MNQSNNQNKMEKDHLLIGASCIKERLGKSYGYNKDLPVLPIDVAEAASRVGKHAHRTPLLTSTGIDKIASMKVKSNMKGKDNVNIKLFFKCENFQRVGAFKFRGAVNSIAQESNADHVVTHSSGNHAQAVALAARLMSKKATIVMPKDAPEVKRKAVEDFGGLYDDFVY